MAVNVGQVKPTGWEVKETNITNNDGSTWTTNTGSFHSSTQWVMLREQNGVTWVASILVRLSSVSTRPTVTIKDNRLKALPAIASELSAIRTASNGSTQYFCDGGGLSHAAGSDTLTISCNSFASTTPSGYFFFIK